MANSQSPAQRATAARSVARLDAGGHVEHKQRKASYASGCNRKAIREAKAKPHVVGIDLDFNPNKQEHPWVHHQLHPTKRDAWFDRLHKIGDAASCRELTDAQMRRFRVKYKGTNWAMLSAHQAASECAKSKGGTIIPCFEAKFQSPLYLDPQWWFDQFINGWSASLMPVIMALPGTNNFGLKKLAAAHEAGLPTVWLWRGNTPITRTKGFANAVDLVKSRPGRGIYRV